MQTLERQDERLTGKQVFERIALTSISNCLLEMKADGCRSGWLWLQNDCEADSWVWKPIELHRETPMQAISVSASAAPRLLLNRALAGLGRLEAGYRAAEALYLEIAQDLDDMAAEGHVSGFMWLEPNDNYLWSPNASDSTGVAITVRPDDEPLTVLCRLTTTQCEVDLDRLLALATGGDPAARLWLDILCYSTPVMEEFGYGQESTH